MLQNEAVIDLLLLWFLQVQEPTGNDEYEVCDPDNSEY